MAEIHVERKPRGRGLLWLLLALVVVAGAAWLYLRMQREVPNVAAPADTTAVADSLPAAQPAAAPVDTAAAAPPVADSGAGIVGNDTTGQPAPQDTASQPEGRLGNP